MSTEDFIKYMTKFNFTKPHIFGNDIIRQNVSSPSGFTINYKHVTVEECAELITSYERDKKINQILDENTSCS